MAEIKLTDEVIIPVMRKHLISREEAETRLHLLYHTDIVQLGNPDDIETQHMIDDFLALDSKEAKAKVVFDKVLTKSLEDENLIKEYDRLRPKAHMGFTLKQIKDNKMNKREEREANKQFKMFADFVREYIFSRISVEEFTL